MKTIGAAWAAAAARIDRLDARLLVEHVAGCRHADLIAHPERPLAAAQATTLVELVGRRRAGEPLAYLVGWAEFRGLRLAVSPAVLVPRPETELLVELALARLADLPAPSVLDLGTGSGAIALAIKAARPQARVLAVDVSRSALAVAQANAKALGLAVDFVASDWYAALASALRVDLIVANPPYVADGDPHLAGDGLRFEPPGALTDGADGLSCLRAIIGGAVRHLVPGGFLLCEHGYDQAAACRELFTAAGFESVGSWRDLAGNERVSGGRLDGGCRQR